MKSIREAVDRFNNKDPAHLTTDQVKKLNYYSSLLRVLDWLEPHSPRCTYVSHNSTEIIEIFSSESDVSSFSGFSFCFVL